MINVFMFLICLLGGGFLIYFQLRFMIDDGYARRYVKEFRQGARLSLTELGDVRYYGRFYEAIWYLVFLYSRYIKKTKGVKDLSHYRYNIIGKMSVKKEIAYRRRIGIILLIQGVILLAIGALWLIPPSTAIQYFARRG